MHSSSIEFDRLKKVGLLVKSNPFGRHSVSYFISKPASILGNTRKNCRRFVTIGSEKIVCDAPSTKFFLEGDKWVFSLHELAPGPGPGDFELFFSDIETAVDSIIDYYFGDPGRMNPSELLSCDEDNK